MKENRKLLKEVLDDIRHDMTDEEVHLLFECHNLLYLWGQRYVFYG